jgi:chromate transport protein ChrA
MPSADALLDGVNVTLLGLMAAAVTLHLGRAALVDPLTIALAIVAMFLLLRFKLNSMWLVVGGGLIGLLASALARRVFIRIGWRMSNVRINRAGCEPPSRRHTTIGRSVSACR